MAPATSPGMVSLPPSVEEAYRRKCVQLKKRMAEVEETNDAARIRLARLKRQVEKQRLERAFLLEQLAKRTSANVEDSDGSPSPPPTQPKEKPLRTKRGHRKSSITGAEGAASGSGAAAGASFISQNLEPLSPGSDVFSHNKGDSQTQATQESETPRRGGRKAKDKGDAVKAKAGDDKNGDGDESKTSKSSGGASGGSSLKRPGNAFELYCEEMRPSLAEKKKAAKNKKQGRDDGEDGDVDMDDIDAGADEDDDATETSIDAELARGWTEMEQSEKDEFEARAAEEQAKYKKAKEDARHQKQKDKDTSEENEVNDNNEGGAEDKEEKGDKGISAKAEESEADNVQGKAKGKEDDVPVAKAGRSPSKDEEDIDMVDPDTPAVTTSSGDKDA